MVNSLLLATIIRIALVIVSTGCKVPAGIFVPSMAVGASFGRMVGIIVKPMYRSVLMLFIHIQNLTLTRAYPNSGIFAYCQPDVPCITPGIYAFLGAAAALRYAILSSAATPPLYLIPSGIMRITVTVVVVMFELTGALTYILPTMVSLFICSCSPTHQIVQIVILVTKAVGDMLGVRGIADEMIRFNGYPFLEKEDHASNVTGMPLDLSLFLE
jgi:chloride channel 3/4/5